MRATRQRRAVRVRLVKAKVEPRETGVVSSLKESFGFIQCADRDERLFFHQSEMADKRPAAPLREGDEVDFLVEKDREGRNMGRAVRVLLPGTVSFVTTLPGRAQGTVDREVRSGSGGKKDGRGGRAAPPRGPLPSRQGHRPPPAPVASRLPLSTAQTRRALRVPPPD